VLDIAKLPLKFRTQFKNLPKHRSMLTAEEMQEIVPEPHPSWVELIEKEWQTRYSTGG